MDEGYKRANSQKIPKILIYVIRVDRRRERGIVWLSDTAHPSPLTVSPRSVGKEGNARASSLEGVVTPCHLLLLWLTQPGMMPP